MNNTPSLPPFDLVIGLDRSDAKADLCLLDVPSGKRRHQTVSTAPEALASWLATLRQVHPKARIALALEQPAGNLIPFFAPFNAHPDAACFAKLPGAGPALAPRLLVAFGSNRQRYPKRESMQRYSGIAPVTKQSGGSHHVHRRYCCPKFLRQSFHEFAGQSILHCRWAAAFYLQLREKGAKHHTAVRALAYKWQRIIWRCWQDETVYKDSIYEKALRHAKSPIVSLFKRVEIGHNPAKESSAKTP